MIVEDFLDGWFIINEAANGGFPYPEYKKMPLDEFMDVYERAVKILQARKDAIENQR